MYFNIKKQSDLEYNILEDLLPLKNIMAFKIYKTTIVTLY